MTQWGKDLKIKSIKTFERIYKDHYYSNNNTNNKK